MRILSIFCASLLCWSLSCGTSSAVAQVADPFGELIVGSDELADIEVPDLDVGATPNMDAEDEDAVFGTITDVTLYREQALVTREIEVVAGDDSGVITVTGLPEMLLAESVFAEGDENVQIRGVRVATRPVSTSDREDVRDLQSQITANVKETARLQQETQILDRNLESLSQVDSFSASKTADDLNRGTLDASTVMELSSYVMEQRRELMLAQYEAAQKIAELREKLGLLQRQFSELSSGNQKNRYEAKVFIAATGAGKVRLNYQVSGCGWSPQYSIRGNVGADQFTIRYSAVVQQISGEAWDQVNLTLSTASPTVSSTGPDLTPLRVTPQSLPQQVAQEFNQSGGSSKQLSERMQSIKQQQRFAENQSYAPQPSDSEMQRDMALNSLATQIQQLELDAEAKVASRIAADADDDVATQVYVLSQPVSLQSRRQQQLVQIEDLSLSGELYYVATPLLSSYAYREAEMTNDQPIGLLGGPASVYLDDRFVGRANIPTTASGQKLLVGFGADQQIRARRELREKKDLLQGGNRSLEFTYRLVVANFKDKPINVRLYDRTPVAAETRDVVVTIVNTTSPISDDPLYKRIAKDQGIVRWDLEIPAGRHGADAFDVEYTFSLVFDKNRVLTTEALAQNMANDLFYQRNTGGGMGGMGGGMGGMGGYGGGMGGGGMGGGYGGSMGGAGMGGQAPGGQ